MPTVPLGPRAGAGAILLPLLRTNALAANTGGYPTDHPPWTLRTRTFGSVGVDALRLAVEAPSHLGNHYTLHLHCTLALARAIGLDHVHIISFFDLLSLELNAIGSPQTAAVLPAQTLAAVPSAPRLPLRVAQPLMDAYRGIPAPAQGTTGTRRLNNAARTLIRGPFATAANHSGPEMRIPAPIPRLSGDYDPPGYSSPKIAIQNRHARKYAQKLLDFHLICDVDVPAQGLMSPAEFSRQIISQLNAHNISFPPFPDDEASGSTAMLDGQLWQLLQPTVRGDIYTFATHKTINDNTFGYAELQKLSKKFVYPLPTAFPGGRVREWVLIAATPLSGIHACAFWTRFHTQGGVHLAASPLSWSAILTSVRLLKRLQVASLIFALPPMGLQRPQTPPPPGQQPQSLIRQRSPPAQIPASTRQVRPRHAPLASPMQVDGSDDDAPPPEEQPLAPICPPLVPLEVGVDVLRISDIADWAAGIESTVTPLLRDPLSVVIRAKTIHAAAECVTDLLVHIEQPAGSDFTMHDPILEAEEVYTVRKDISIESFFLSYRAITIGAPGMPTTHGVGPERAILRAGCAVLASRHHFWQKVPRSTMFRPIFSPIDIEIPDRVRTFRAHGRFLALHCYLSHHGPLPISIWVLLALIIGREAMNIPQNLLLHLDPGAHDQLAPWYEFHEESPVPRANDPTNPLRQFILEHMDATTAHPRSTRAEKYPRLHRSPWNTFEFVGLRDGFNIGISTLRFAETIRALCALPFLVAIYDCRIKTVQDVVNHLRYHARTGNKLTPYYIKLFTLRLTHHLNGVGHLPQFCPDDISEDELHANKSNPLLRVNLLLIASTESEMLPMNEDWYFQFRFHAEDTREDGAFERPLGFHTCFGYADVYLDRAFREILLEPVLDDGRQLSKFDVWIHSQLLHPVHNTG
ncbi:hypothetical protein C8F04DRAFT_1283372 [Mycena alexandri]|uniref:Uncharacterized protein n=1 Tax=Mycena alexandri TaxID=1745969 RepID=A0AAD6WJZ9_9AGAR|nr:hypothetical protein C8F04DRAFT_1283372 [Mycena alexandri]